MAQQSAGAVARLVRDQRLTLGTQGKVLSNTVAIDHAILVVAPDVTLRLFVLFDDLHGRVFGGDEQFELGPLLRLFNRLKNL